MAEQIKSGTGNASLARVTGDNRLLVDGLFTLASSERSLTGNLFGLGTGGLTVADTMALGSVMWLRNDATSEDLLVQKLIFGWNGGSTTWIKTVFSLIFYQTAAPTANHTAIDDQIENISKTGSAAVKSDKITAYKWDGAGSGMTSGTGGFAQIPNRIAKGNTSIPIDGEIVLGPGNSMEFRVTPEETGLFHVSVVYYFVPSGKGRSGI